MILLIDHNLPPHLARIMHSLADQDGHRVEHVRHRYGDGVADVDWMAQLAEERVSALSRSMSASAGGLPRSRRWCGVAATLM